MVLSFPVPPHSLHFFFLPPQHVLLLALNHSSVSSSLPPLSLLSSSSLSSLFLLLSPSFFVLSLFFLLSPLSSLLSPLSSLLSPLSSLLSPLSSLLSPLSSLLSPLSSLLSPLSSLLFSGRSWYWVRALPAIFQGRSHHLFYENTYWWCSVHMEARYSGEWIVVTFVLMHCVSCSSWPSPIASWLNSYTVLKEQAKSAPMSTFYWGVVIVCRFPPFLDVHSLYTIQQERFGTVVSFWWLGTKLPN